MSLGDHLDELRMRLLYALAGVAVCSDSLVAAMATPPDVVSQIALAIPLYLLFELGVLLSYLASRRKTSS